MADADQPPSVLVDDNACLVMRLFLVSNQGKLNAVQAAEAVTIDKGSGQDRTRRGEA